jgi:hypothetical protein
MFTLRAENMDTISQKHNKGKRHQMVCMKCANYDCSGRYNGRDAQVSLNASAAVWVAPSARHDVVAFDGATTGRY